MCTHQRQRERSQKLRNKSKDSWALRRNAVREVGWGMTCSQQMRTKEGGHSGGEEDTGDDAGFDVRQLSVRKDEAEER